MPRRRRLPGGKKGDRHHPSREFVAELRALAELTDNDVLEMWIRDVRPVVRQVARAELERRGVKHTPDTMAI